MRRCVVAALVTALGVFAAPASAHLQGHVGTQQRGWVALRLWGGKPHALVSVYERNARIAQVQLGGRGRAFVRRLSQWQCGARQRVFQIRALTLTTRTPGCATRLGDRRASAARARAIGSRSGYGTAGTSAAPP